MLTEAAKSALPELGKAFAHLARAVEGVRGGSLVGPLVVTIIPSFAGRWLVPRLGGFIDAYPEIEITVRAELRNVDFAREDVDVGIRYGKGIYPGLETRLLLTEDVFPVCAPTLLAGERPLKKLDDLRHHTLLHDRQLSSEEPSLYWRNWLRDFGAGGWDADRGPGFTDSLMMMAACERGLGVALGRGGLCADELASGKLVRPFPAEPAGRLLLLRGGAGRARRGAQGARVPGLARGRGRGLAPGYRRPLRAPGFRSRAPVAGKKVLARASPPGRAGASRRGSELHSGARTRCLRVGFAIVLGRCASEFNSAILESAGPPSRGPAPSGRYCHGY